MKQEKEIQERLEILQDVKKSYSSVGTKEQRARVDAGIMTLEWVLQ